jgi:hypothetical protein
MIELTVDEDTALASIATFSLCCIVQRLLLVSLTSSEPRQMPPYHNDLQNVPSRLSL